MTKYNLLQGASVPPAWYRLLTLVPLAMIVLFMLLPVDSAAQEPVSQPATTPDAETGLQIYAERCATCHGPSGMGDGELAAQSPQPPTALGSQAYIRRATPAHMFDLITNGNVTSGMPPFGPSSRNPISEANRWDLIAAIYSLGTPADVVERGRSLYEANCMACHGARGAVAAVDLSQPAYWLQRSDESVHSTLAEAAIEEHQAFELTEDEWWDVVSYARTFSYHYIDPNVANAPIEAAVITGKVTNETTATTPPEGTPVELVGFTANFEQSITMTTTLNVAGEYTFNLRDVPPYLDFVVTSDYKGVSFASEVGRLDRDEPTLNLPVTVYEHTTDASTVRVSQLHLILEFRDGVIAVNELYQFSQRAPAVFVGESGDMRQGTIQIALPEGASPPSFSRSFSGIESFFPAQNVIETEQGWADTVPLRPGNGTLSLLVRYTLPYESGLSFNHAIHYPVENLNLLVPDAGVTLVDAEQWQEREPQAAGAAGNLLNYSQTALDKSDMVRFTLEGRPDWITTDQGRVAVRDETTELLIGGIILLLVLVVAGTVIYIWQQPQGPYLATSEGGQVEASPQAVRQRREELLHAIAALDEAYEAGEVEESSYGQQRAVLKEALIAIWEVEE